MPTTSTNIAPKFEVKSRASLASAPTKISVSNLNFFYGRTQALNDITVDVPERMVMAFIGPSGCGKTTFLRTRSEEHTSELQSQSNLVCRLLLEKKKRQ